jgi:hypothetical protein
MANVQNEHGIEQYVQINCTATLQATFWLFLIRWYGLPVENLTQGNWARIPTRKNVFQR